MPNKSALISILFFLYKSPGTTFPLRENVAVARLLRSCATYFCFYAQFCNGCAVTWHAFSLRENTHMARWLSWLERRPVTAEVKGSSPFRVALEVLAHMGEHMLCEPYNFNTGFCVVEKPTSASRMSPCHKGSSRKRAPPYDLCRCGGTGRRTGLKILRA